MRTILLTGGTGFIGSFLSLELLKRGNFVIFLARQKGMLSAKERVELILKFINPALYKSLIPYYRVVEGDITKAGLGLSNDAIDYILGARPSAIFHSAGAIDFAEEKEKITRLINFEGAKNVLEFASEANIRQFHHFSTLYVAGDREGEIFENELFVGQSFNNPYEETKAQAERLVHEWAEGNKGNYKIYRLPIVVGDSQNGKTLTFTGFYRFFKPFWELKESIREKINIDPRLEKAGIRFENGYISAPLFVKCAGNSLIDLVPIDWITRNICLLSEVEDGNLTFHLSHPFASSSAEIIQEVLPLIGLKGLQFIFVNGDTLNPEYRHGVDILDVYQRMVDRITGEYFAYNVNRKKFVSENLIRVFGDNYSPPPAIDSRFLQKILDYAIKQKFKKPTFA